VIRPCEAGTEHQVGGAAAHGAAPPRIAMWVVGRHPAHPKSPNLEFRIVCPAPTPAVRSVARPCVRCDPCGREAAPCRAFAVRLAHVRVPSPQRATRNAQPQVGTRRQAQRRRHATPNEWKSRKAKTPRAVELCFAILCGLRFYIFSRFRVLLFSFISSIITRRRRDDTQCQSPDPPTHTQRSTYVNSWLLVHAHPQIQQNVKCCKCTRT
jgi:hypothetical protein